MCSLVRCAGSVSRKIHTMDAYFHRVTLFFPGIMWRDLVIMYYRHSFEKILCNHIIIVSRMCVLYKKEYLKFVLFCEETRKAKEDYLVLM